MNLKWIFRVIVALNCLLIAGFFGKAYLLESEIERLRVIAQAFAEEHNLFPLEKVEMNMNNPLDSDSIEKFDQEIDLRLKYIELFNTVVELRSKQRDFISYGKMGFLGFAVVGLVAGTVYQRKSDNLKLPMSRILAFQETVFTTPTNRNGKSKQVVFSIDKKTVYFDGFALLKGLVILPKKKTFEIPFETIIDCFIVPLRGGNTHLVLLTTMGKITIDDTISGYQRLYLNLKALSALTPDPKLFQKPWFQGVLNGFIILGGSAAVFGIYLYFFA